MLHAPASESKQRNEPTRQAVLPCPRDFHPGVRDTGTGYRGRMAQAQRAYGNQAVLRMLSRSPAALQRKCSCGGSSPGDCGCKEERERVVQRAVHLTGADKATPGHLQRDTKKTPDPKKKRQSVVLLGEAVKGGAELAGVLAPGAHIVKVKNVDDAAAALGKIDFPIATLYVIAHSSREGGVKFGDEGFVKPADIAA